MDTATGGRMHYIRIYKHKKQMDEGAFCYVDTATGELALRVHIHFQF